MITWPSFGPDLADNNPAYTDGHMNVVPIDGAWAPVQSFAELSTSASVGAAPKGAYPARVPGGTVVPFVMTSTAAFKYDASSISFTEVTATSSTTSAFNYSGTEWGMHQHYNLLIAANGSDATQSVDVTSTANFDDLANAPIAKHVASIGDSVILGNLSSDERAVAISGIGDATYWTYGERGSASKSFPDAGAVQGFFEYDKSVAVFLEDKIYSIDFVGGETVYGSRTLQENIGCMAPKSIVPVRNTCFWYSPGGFYMDVGQAIPIGAERVNRFVASVADTEELANMRGGLDPQRKIVWWAFKATSGSYKWIGYNWVIKQWSPIVDLGVEFLFPMSVTSGFTFDTWDDLSATFDGLPSTFNGAIYAASNEVKIAGINSDGDFGFFDGAVLEATLESADNQFNPKGYTWLENVRLASDAPSSAVTAQVGHKQNYGQEIMWETAKAVNPSHGLAWFNKRAMLHRVRYKIASGAMWKDTTGVHVNERPDGDI